MLWEDAVHEDGMPYKKFIGPNITPEALDELLAVTGIEEYCSGEGVLALYTSLELVPGLCAILVRRNTRRGQPLPGIYLRRKLLEAGAALP